MSFLYHICNYMNFNHFSNREVYYINWLLYIESSLHLRRKKSTWLWYMTFFNIKFLNCTYLFIYLFSLCAHIWAMVHMSGSEDSLQELVLSSYHVGHQDWTLAVRLGSQHLYPLSHLTNPMKDLPNVLLDFIFSFLLGSFKLCSWGTPVCCFLSWGFGTSLLRASENRPGNTPLPQLLGKG